MPKCWAEFSSEENGKGISLESSSFREGLVSPWKTSIETIVWYHHSCIPCASQFELITTHVSRGDHRCCTLKRKQHPIKGMKQIWIYIFYGFLRVSDILMWLVSIQDGCKQSMRHFTDLSDDRTLFLWNPYKHLKSVFWESLENIIVFYVLLNFSFGICQGYWKDMCLFNFWFSFKLFLKWPKSHAELVSDFRGEKTYHFPTILQQSHNSLDLINLSSAAISPQPGNSRGAF